MTVVGKQMKSVMVSIKPKYCELIASGQKIIVIRKTRPKEVPFKCYIYCIKGHPVFTIIDGKLGCSYYYRTDTVHRANGKVIGEFICDYIEQLNNLFVGEPPCRCLTMCEIEDYGNEKMLYGWHISELKIYDEPIDLSDFYKPCNGDCFGNGRPKITRPPQSWMYVEDMEERK